MVPVNSFILKMKWQLLLQTLGLSVILTIYITKHSTDKNIINIDHWHLRNRAKTFTNVKKRKVVNV